MEGGRVARSWVDLAPHFTWRPSQRHLLELAGHVGDRRWHLCAPPGAGKTLIGLELARRVAAPTLVLAPTIAVRDQWRAATEMFGADPARFSTDDPAVAAPLVAATYQLLGNPGEAAAELRAAARRLWVTEVAADADLDLAEQRVRTTEQRDPPRARRELHRHVRMLRRSLSRHDDLGVPRAALLGERTVALVDRLAAAGIGCLVLDECHHLLDWWALVVGALVERLSQDRDVAVSGLTATLPDPDSSREAENYRGLLGDIDAELHLAAMVAEGGVAPWRDGLCIAHLTDSEEAFLDRWTERFATELDAPLLSESFVGWAVAQVTEAALDAHVRLPEDATDPAGWDRFWDRDPPTAAALARWWRRRGLALPAGFTPPGAARTTDDLGLADRLVLLHAWLHDPAAALADGTRQEIEKLVNRYGVVLSTAGVRWGRSAADLVCALSSAKGAAAAGILAREAERRGEKLRALVVVERDRATTPPAAAREVLGEDAGTTARVLAGLCQSPDVVELGVMAVTGRGAWADALSAESICAAINVSEAGTGRWVRAEGCDIRGAVRLTGQGGSWTGARWLAAAEVALDDGAVHVLVATRGLVGEGWDHPQLNVLVDLSEVASAAATTQLRGRAIRLDPTDGAKVASLWDVVVAHPDAPGDWDRMRRRHGRWWGPDAAGAVTTGSSKLHARAGRPDPPAGEELGRVNAESAAAVADEARTRAAWQALDPAGVGSSAVHVRSQRRRQVRTRGAGWRWLAGAAFASMLGGSALVVPAVSSPALWPVVAAATLGAAGLGLTARGRHRGPGDTLAALAEAVLAGLLAAGRRDLAPARVAVEPDPAGGWLAVAEGIPDDAAQVWADALAETLGPLGSPRWLVARRGTDRAWRVPSPVGTTKAAAAAFVRAFRSRVPGAELVRAGTPRATELVLIASRERPDEIGRSLRWRPGRS
jgi:superfamily II DNA or RNA helicase